VEDVMKVRELIQWLATVKDQDAEVEVVQHSRGTGYYDQGGNASAAAFDPEKHTTYTNLRRTLLLGELDA
jgi:hypothetical protein